MSHGHGEDDNGIGALSLDQLLEVLPPTRGDPAPDHLSRHSIPEPVLRVVLGAS